MGAQAARFRKANWTRLIFVRNNPQLHAHRAANQGEIGPVVTCKTTRVSELCSRMNTTSLDLRISITNAGNVVIFFLHNRTTTWDATVGIFSLMSTAIGCVSKTFNRSMLSVYARQIRAALLIE